MKTLAEFVHYLYLAAFGALSVIAVRQWRQRRDRAALWAALSFAALGVVVLGAEVLPDDSDAAAVAVAERFLFATLVLFPYLLYRFTRAFSTPSRGVERLTGALTTLLLVATFLLPEFPDEGEPWSLAYWLYLGAFLIHWTLLSSIVSVRLWRGGRGQPGVARRRMQMLSLASAAITIALFLAVGGEAPAVELGVALLALTSALAFLLGLAPPPAVRLLWRRREQEQTRAAIGNLMRAQTEEEVIRHALPPIVRMVGARAAALLDHDGRALGGHEVTEEMEEDAARVPLGGEVDTNGGKILRLEIEPGSLVLWTTPYAPFFGTEELELLRSLGDLIALALDRARLFAHERAARESLEQADELKSNFVSLAAHELRTPVTSIHGVGATLVHRREQLGEDQVHDLHRILYEQTERLRLLVEQLLDLSRLDANAVPIEPEPIAVRARVEELARTVADEDADVRVEIDEALTAVADPQAFERVVSNLIVNALRHGKPPVTVRAEQRDRHFRVSVEDRGEGVPPELVPTLFERFARGERARGNTAGTGLGLAIARSYAHAHRGELVYAPAEPHGSRFELVLPREPGPTGPDVFAHGRRGSLSRSNPRRRGVDERLG